MSVMRDDVYDQIGELDDKCMQLVAICKELTERVDSIENALVSKGLTVRKRKEPDDTCTVM